MVKRIAFLVAVMAAAVPATAAAPAAEVRLDGYAEWLDGATLVVDGQRVRLAPGGRFRGEGEARSADSVPLGYELRARGRRLADGTVLAEEPRQVLDLLGAPEKEVVFGGRTHWTYPGGAVVFERGRVSEVRF